jgi:DNA-binding NtrC family response regulator
VSAKPGQKIMVVDDEPDVGMIFHRILGEAGFEVVSASSGVECLRTLKKLEPQLVFLDLRMPGMDGVEVLRRIREIHAALPVVIMTAYQTVATAVEAMKLGAYDYLIKPLQADHLKAIVKQALEVREMARRTPAVHSAAPGADRLNAQDVVAKSREMERVMELVGKVAPTDMTVLILGESGTGKEVMARAIHRLGKRKDKPFVVVDCAALPDTLIESELFGYEKGAFTGADAARPGKFEQADGGTLFLDEIGNLPPTTQAKLLRFLQEPTIERLGGRKGPVALDVRILAATNVDLEKGVAQGTFREDLYHRLKVFVVDLPPLRNRGREDLDWLVMGLVDDFRRKLGRNHLSVDPETMQLLKTYPWPGNIRELQNALRSAALLADDIILPDHLPMSVRSVKTSVKAKLVDLNEILRHVEKEHIAGALAGTKGDIHRAAEELGLDVPTLQRKIADMGL